MNDEKYIQVMISRRGLILISTHMCVPTIYKKTRFVKCTERSHLKYIYRCDLPFSMLNQR